MKTKYQRPPDKVDYQIVQYLSTCGDRPPRAKNLSEATGIPLDTVYKRMKSLRKRGLAVLTYQFSQDLFPEKFVFRVGVDLGAINCGGSVRETVQKFTDEAVAVMKKKALDCGGGFIVTGHYIVETGMRIEVDILAQTNTRMVALLALNALNALRGVSSMLVGHQF